MISTNKAINAQKQHPNTMSKKGKCLVGSCSRFSYIPILKGVKNVPSGESTL
jgi:hypothetical protein